MYGEWRYGRGGPGIHRNREFRRSKIEFWAWIIVSTLTTGFIGVETHFMEKCSQTHVFESFLFKASSFLFLCFVGCAAYLLYQLRGVANRRFSSLWNNNTKLTIATFVVCLLSVTSFTISLAPAYHQASFVFFVLGFLFLVNLGCLLLLD